MNVGYARVSTIDQKLDLQEDALRQAGCEKIYTDTLSGTKTQRPGLAAALDQLRAGDTFIVWKLDRLGRSVKDLITIVTRLREEDIAFRSLHEQVDTTSTMGKFFFTILAAIAELERNIIVDRTQAGLQAARARGRLGGAPRKMTKAQQRTVERQMANPKTIVKELAEAMGVSTATIYRHMEWAKQRENRRSMGLADPGDDEVG